MGREFGSHIDTFVFVVCNPNHVAGTETGLEIQLFKDLGVAFRLSERAELPIVIVSDTPEKADASLRARRAQHVLLIPKPFTATQIARCRARGLTMPAFCAA